MTSLVGYLTHTGGQSRFTRYFIHYTQIIRVTSRGLEDSFAGGVLTSGSTSSLDATITTLIAQPVDPALWPAYLSDVNQVEFVR